MLPEYTFVSWLRRGVAAEISTPDRLGAHPDDGPDGRAAVPVELTLDYTPVGGGTSVALPAIRRDVFILGPGDVAAMKPEAIIRTYPSDRTLGATPGELAYVEFYDEDFPWRYTPAAADGSKLRPWIALLVLTDDEFELRERHGALPVVTVDPDVVLPARLETWAWAHAQISGIVAAAADVDTAIRTQPDHALARLLSPRRLLPATAYHAFIVPAFESGRLAGLGRDTHDTPVQKPSWGTPSHESDRDLPVYHRFSFTTGTAGDFETLARKLVPAPVGQAFGKRPLDVSDPGYGITPAQGAQVELEGALAPPDFERDDFEDAPDGARAAQLAGILDAGEERRTSAVQGTPLVLPPIYGRWHAGVTTVLDTAGDEALAWLRELNLDLRNRAAAGLGVEIVRERQEELVQRAWEQVGEVEQANQRLREAELARSVGEAIFRKHVVPATDDRVLVMTSTAQAGLSVPAANDTQSIRGAVDVSRVPAAAQAPAFRRITRPQRPLMRRLTGKGDLTEFQDGLIDAMNADPDDALSTAPPAPPPAAGVSVDAVTTAVSTSISQLQAEQGRPDRVFLELVNVDLRARRLKTPPENLDHLPPALLRTALTSRLATRIPGSSPAEVEVKNRVLLLIGGITAVASDGADGAAVTLTKSSFEAEYGSAIAGKAYAGIVVMSANPPPNTEVARTAELGDVQRFGSELGSFKTTVLDARPNPGPRDPLADPATLAPYVLSALDPAVTITDRVASALPVIAARPANDPGRLAPVMAYPEFRDPLFQPLRALSQDHIIPNVSDLPRDSLTLMEPNARFIESVLAGANHAFAQELLWREYPTDQRGTYFKVFWDTRDALGSPNREDIDAMPEWDGALGDQAALPASVLVLVIRGELLEKYPSTVIYAQRARWPGTDTSAPRELDPTGTVLHPIFHARLEPDISMVGFELSEEQARGHRPTSSSDPVVADPGWFFVLMERPGEPRFGLDDATPPGGLQTWNDLAWDALDFPDGTAHIELAPNPLTPALTQPAVWARTAADMAAILCQNPVLMARHASEMLPP